MELKGRFTTNTTIKVRRNPSLKGSVVPSSDWLLANQWVDFVSITKKDGYWWAKFKYPTNPSSGYFYCALCKITDKQERIKKRSIGVPLSGNNMLCYLWISIQFSYKIFYIHIFLYLEVVLATTSFCIKNSIRVSLIRNNMLYYSWMRIQLV